MRLAKPGEEGKLLRRLALSIVASDSSRKASMPPYSKARAGCVEALGFRLDVTGDMDTQCVGRALRGDPSAIAKSLNLWRVGAARTTCGIAENDGERADSKVPGLAKRVSTGIGFERRCNYCFFFFWALERRFAGTE